MESTRLLLVRHGETAWNADGRLQGHLDIALNDVGRAQARRLAAALADEREPIDIIYSSDLARALQTAQAVADATGAPLIATPALRERDFGAFQGRSFAAIEAELPREAERWRRRDPDWAPPGAGESLLQFKERITHAVCALAAQNIGKHVAMFTHGGVLDVLYRAATRQDIQAPRTWQLGNAAINRLLWTPGHGLALVGWGDSAHLQGESGDETSV